MTTLDAYLTGKYVEDNAFCIRLSQVISDSLKSFAKQSTTLRIRKKSATTGATWQYAVSSNPDERQTRVLEYLSPSTHCMIVFALQSLLSRGLARNSRLLGKGYKPIRLPQKERDELQSVVAKALDAAKALVLTAEEKALVSSSTYGKDDPFTLAWLAELLFTMPEPSAEPGKEEDADAKQQREQAKEELARARETIVTTALAALQRPAILDTEGTEGGFRELRSCFLPVRRLHLAHTLASHAHERQDDAKRWIEGASAKLWGQFDAELHRQLSFAAMEDSRFDPAELAFALEGALMLHPTWISPVTIDKVFDGLRLSRERQPFWRPTTPLLGNDRGHVLFLVSIEVANSLLRSCEILDSGSPSPRRFAEIESQLREYSVWLLGEREEVSVTDQNGSAHNLVGWRSEYEDRSDRGTIYLWYTSHVIVFLNHYRSLLQAMIGADAARAAGLSIRPAAAPWPSYWMEDPIRWGQERYHVLSTIESQYVTNSSQDGETIVRPHSLLLYGPPGTGKTTLAEQLADRLERPLILVTVSDFLAAGAAEIENRAKGVFQALQSQNDVVVLFDEIDQFLLDRNSGLYQDQDDVFKFMTPGMLTKLQNLRQAENCIFIVSTNYYERIDSAIKRAGRIDRHFLLSVPDATQRTNLLVDFVTKKLGHPKDGEYASKIRQAIPDNGVLAATALFGRGDLSNLVNLRVRITDTQDAVSTAKALAVAAADIEPATSLASYRARFDGKSQYPFEEFFLLVGLIAESERKFSDGEREVVHLALNRVQGFNGPDSFASLNAKGIVDDPDLYSLLAKHKDALLDGYSKPAPTAQGHADSRSSAKQTGEGSAALPLQ